MYALIAILLLCFASVINLILFMWWFKMNGELIVVSMIFLIGQVVLFQLYNQNWFKKENFKMQKKLVMDENKLKIRKVERELGLNKSARLEVEKTDNSLLDVLKNIDADKITGLLDLVGNREVEEGEPAGMMDTVLEFANNNPEIANQFVAAMNFPDEMRKADRIEFNKKILSGELDPRSATLQRIQEIEAAGGDATNLRDNLALGDNELIRENARKELNFLDPDAMISYNKLMGGSADDKTAEMRNFEDKTQGLTEEEKLKAQKIALGLLAVSMSSA